MGMLISLLAAVAGIGSLVCWIIILIEMFKNESVISGILGIICAIWAFIWGWMNVNKYGKRQIMQIWTACIVVGIVLQIARSMIHA